MNIEWSSEDHLVPYELNNDFQCRFFSRNFFRIILDDSDYQPEHFQEVPVFLIPVFSASTSNMRTVEPENPVLIPGD